MPDPTPGNAKRQSKTAAAVDNSLAEPDPIPLANIANSTPGRSIALDFSNQTHHHTQPPVGMSPILLRSLFRRRLASASIYVVLVRPEPQS